MDDLIKIDDHARFRNFVPNMVRFICKKQNAEIKEMIEAERVNARRALAKEIKKHQSTIEKLTKQVDAKKAELIKIRQQIDIAMGTQELLAGQDWKFNWPRVPTFKFDLMFSGEKNNNIPGGSGVYFLWSSEVVEYVGQSINLPTRVTLNHEKAKSHGLKTASILPLNSDLLIYAEAFYIGLLRPNLNNRTPS